MLYGQILTGVLACCSVELSCAQSPLSGPWTAAGRDTDQWLLPSHSFPLKWSERNKNYNTKTRTFGVWLTGCGYLFVLFWRNGTFFQTPATFSTSKASLKLRKSACSVFGLRNQITKAAKSLYSLQLSACSGAIFNSDLGFILDWKVCEAIGFLYSLSLFYISLVFRNTLRCTKRETTRHV